MKIWIKNIALFFVFGLFFITKVHTQCKERVLTYIKEIGSITEVPKGAHFKLVNRLTYNQEFGGLKNEVSQEIKMIGNRFIYDTEIMSVYQDEVDQFVLIHTQKIITWQNAQKVSNKEEIAREMVSFQDSLISTSKELACVEKKVGKSTHWMGTFEVNSVIKKDHNIKRLITETDQDTKQLKNIKVFYADHPDGIEVKEVEYAVMNFNYKGKLPLRLKELVLDKNNGLIKKYAEYKLIDERNAKTSN